jgi:hypothetical protein
MKKSSKGLLNAQDDGRKHSYRSVECGIVREDGSRVLSQVGMQMLINAPNSEGRGHPVGKTECRIRENALREFKSKPSMKMLMLATILIFMLFATNGCDKLRRFDPGGLPNCKQPPKTITPFVINQDPLGLRNGGILQQNVVIKDSVAWNTLLDTIRSIDNDCAKLLTFVPIDFSTHQVIAVFDEVHNYGHWYTEIADIKEYCFYIVVTYRTWQVESYSSFRQPFDVVRIPASNKQIVFIKEEEDVANVPYNVCPEFSQYIISDTTFFKVTGYVFIDTLPAIKKNNTMYICYRPAQDTATFSMKGYKPYGPPWTHSGKICNFPNFAKAWVIPAEGKEIDYKGEFYCRLQVQFSETGFLVLTTLKEK